MASQATPQPRNPPPHRRQDLGAMLTEAGLAAVCAPIWRYKPARGTGREHETPLGTLLVAQVKVRNIHHYTRTA